MDFGAATLHPLAPVGVQWDAALTPRSTEHAGKDIRRMIDRRSVTGLGLAGAVAILADCRRLEARTTDIPVQQLGVIANNDRGTAKDWERWLGRAQNHQSVYFNQQSWAALEASVDFIVALGRSIQAAGRRVHWSVPVGGARAYGEAASGAHDALFQRIAQGILTSTPAQAGRICIRLPWEFNLETQSLAARDASGRWDQRPYVAAFRRMASIFRRASARFYFDWCPNIGQGGLNPELCYPGDDLVDIVSVDLYYRGQYDDQGRRDAGAGIFYYRKSQPFGLDWLSGFGRRHGKLIGLSEWGVDDNRATEFMRLMTRWIQEQGASLAHHNYWDRVDGGIDSRLSDGHLPAVGAVYRQAFGR
jgi:hypothetical protein